MQKFNPFQPSFAIQLLFPITRIIVRSHTLTPLYPDHFSGVYADDLQLQPTARSRTSAASLKTMRRIGSKLIASKKAEVLGSAGVPQIDSEHVRSVDAKVGKQDVKGKDLLSLLIKSNMAEDLAEGERMTEEEILARESSVFRESNIAHIHETYADYMLLTLRTAEIGTLSHCSWATPYLADILS